MAAADDTIGDERLRGPKAMSDDRVELVRRAYEAWNTAGPGALAPFVADSIELHDAPELPDSGSWYGRDAVLARLDEVAAAVGGGWVELQGFRPHGSEVIVTMLWQLGAGSDDASLGQVFHVVRVGAGAITRLRVFLDEAAALRAAGAPE